MVIVCLFEHMLFHSVDVNMILGIKSIWNKNYYGIPQMGFGILGYNYRLALFRWLDNFGLCAFVPFGIENV